MPRRRSFKKGVTELSTTDHYTHQIGKCKKAIGFTSYIVKLYVGRLRFLSQGLSGIRHWNFFAPSSVIKQVSQKESEFSEKYRIQKTERRIQSTEHWIQKNSDYRIKNAEHRIQKKAHFQIGILVNTLVGCTGWYRQLLDTLMHSCTDSLLHRCTDSRIHRFADSLIHWLTDSLPQNTAYGPQIAEHRTTEYRLQTLEYRTEQRTQTTEEN